MKKQQDFTKTVELKRPFIQDLSTAVWRDAGPSSSPAAFVGSISHMLHCYNACISVYTPVRVCINIEKLRWHLSDGPIRRYQSVHVITSVVHQSLTGALFKILIRNSEICFRETCCWLQWPYIEFHVSFFSSVLSPVSFPCRQYSCKLAFGKDKSPNYLFNSSKFIYYQHFKKDNFSSSLPMLILIELLSQLKRISCLIFCVIANQ